MVPAAPLVVALLVACGGRGHPEPYETELTAPWTELHVPVAGGRVVYSDATMLTVHYDGGERDAQVAAWSTALEAAGLTKQAEAPGTDLVSSSWVDADRVVAVGVIVGESRVEVSATVFPKP